MSCRSYSVRLSGMSEFYSSFYRKTLAVRWSCNPRLWRFQKTRSWSGIRGRTEGGQTQSRAWLFRSRTLPPLPILLLSFSCPYSILVFKEGWWVILLERSRKPSPDLPPVPDHYATTIAGFTHSALGLSHPFRVIRSPDTSQWLTGASLFYSSF